MSDYSPKRVGGTRPMMLFQAVNGGQLVTSAGLVAGSGATDVAGVAGGDGGVGSTVTLYFGGIQRLIAAAAISVGQPLKAGGVASVLPWVAGSDPVASLIGKALTAGAFGNVVECTLPGV